MKSPIAQFLVVIFLTSPLLAADPLYTLKPGDQVEVKVVGHSELNITQPITPDGTLSIPLVGRTKVAGKTLYELDTTLKKGLEPYIEKPVITVVLKPEEQKPPESPTYFVTFHNLKTNALETKTARSIDEVIGLVGGEPYTVLLAPTTPALTDLKPGQTVVVNIGTAPDFWEQNWYKIVSAASVITGIVLSLRR
ncbi:MAG: polysaccharide biosynthesis/export family protein [Candidatus Margulisiibacteriota bacterium]